MNECKGKWESSITWTRRHKQDIPVAQQVKESDGIIRINAHNLEDFTGKHEHAKTRNLKKGKCKSVGGGLFHISFEREDDEIGVTEIFIFDGEHDGTKIRGTVKVDTDALEPGDSGTWESTKQGGDDDDDDDDKKNDKDRGSYASQNAEQRTEGSDG
jgi:hypothetical protein